MLGKKDAVKAIQSKSEGIMSVFTSTVSSLESVNEQAQSEMDARAEQIKVLVAEGEVLDNQVKENQKVINKIKDFLNS